MIVPNTGGVLLVVLLLALLGGALFVLCGVACALWSYMLDALRWAWKLVVFVDRKLGEMI